MMHYDDEEGDFHPRQQQQQQLQPADHHDNDYGSYASTTASEAETRRRRNKYLLWGGVALLLVVVAVVVPIVVLTSNDNNNNNASSINGSGLSKADLQSLVTTAYSDAGLDANAALSDPNSPASLALQWLAQDKLKASQTTVLLQRFALAAMYFATYNVANVRVTSPQPWTSSSLWLTEQSECGWEGVLCSPRGTVLGLALENHGLSGSLPMELALLRDHFTTLDLSSNLIYMEGSQLDLFTKLTNMNTLLLDDNFIVSTDGLPTSLNGLSNLQMIRLSYNLIQGTLNGTLLQSLSQLTHLEVESNYLSGSIPSQVGSLSNLVYLYMRRNNMDLDLNFVKYGPMQNLFAMWLDDNNVTGTIPTQLGRLSNLASLSITNATLTGTIPTQLGLLTNMQRLWLYTNQLRGTIPTQLNALSELSVLELQNNQLTGTMPRKLCQIIKAASYAKKSLACDCNANVTCTCCTTCYPN